MMIRLPLLRKKKNLKKEVNDLSSYVDLSQKIMVQVYLFMCLL